MKRLFKQDNFVIAKDDIKGFCVISNKIYYTGECVYMCPVTTIPFDDIKEESNFSQYLMDWDDKENCISFGIINLLNHSDKPNISLLKNYKEKTIIAIAREDIKPNEELTIKYKCKLWFEKV